MFPDSQEMADCHNFEQSKDYVNNVNRLIKKDRIALSSCCQNHWINLYLHFYLTS